MGHELAATARDEHRDACSARPMLVPRLCASTPCTNQHVYCSFDRARALCLLEQLLLPEGTLR